MDSAVLVELGLFTSSSDVENYLFLVSGGIGLLVASLVWRRLRPHRLPEPGEVGEAEHIR